MSPDSGALYDRCAFTYDRDSDCFICPADKLLHKKTFNQRDKLVVYSARTSDCAACALKSKCTTSKHRTVSRHLHEDALQANAQRLQERPEMMDLRRQTAEHPFAFIKNQVMVNARLLLRGLRGAATELGLAALAHNLKRAFNMKGGAWMLQAVRG